MIAEPLDNVRDAGTAPFCFIAELVIPVVLMVGVKLFVITEPVTGAKPPRDIDAATPFCGHGKAEVL